MLPQDRMPPAMVKPKSPSLHPGDRPTSGTHLSTLSFPHCVSTELLKFFPHPTRLCVVLVQRKGVPHTEASGAKETHRRKAECSVAEISVSFFCELFQQAQTKESLHRQTFKNGGGCKLGCGFPPTLGRRSLGEILLTRL